MRPSRLFCLLIAFAAGTSNRPVPAEMTQTPASGAADSGAGRVAFVEVNNVGFEFVLLDGGEFMMGSDEWPAEQPVHRVGVPTFGLGRTEVTVRQFEAFTRETGHRTQAEKDGRAWKFGWTPADVNWRQPGFRQMLDNPVVCVSWHDATAFCDWLGGKMGVPLRLPSEAEWEFACRAGSSGQFAGNLEEIAWYAGNSQGSTHPVWQKPPNRWGLYGMHGNAWEWCADSWHLNYSNAPANGSAWLEMPDAGTSFPSGEGAVLRGGAWALPAASDRTAQNGEDCRASSRAAYPKRERCNNSGFRVALDASAWKTLKDRRCAVRPAGTVTEFSVYNVPFRFAFVPPGDFMMGSQEGGIFPFSHKPVHRVRIGRGFHLGATEVTFRQFRVFAERSQWTTDAERTGWIAGSRGRRFEKRTWAHAPEVKSPEEAPVVGVSWNDANAFCQWLAQETRRAIRLPSEAEWEYACRAGLDDRVYETHLDEYGWHAQNCQQAQPAGRKKANPWGLFDMLGNAAEWCADVWHDQYHGELPPLDGTPWQPAPRLERVIRGGHWACGPQTKLLSAYARESAEPEVASTQVGFRIVWDE